MIESDFLITIPVIVQEETVDYIRKFNGLYCATIDWRKCQLVASAWGNTPEKAIENLRVKIFQGSDYWRDKR